MQPEYEQLVLPFVDEVLVVLHKTKIHHAVAGSRALDTETRRLMWRVEHTAKVLGFGVLTSVLTREQRGDWIHTSLRTEAERL